MGEILLVQIKTRIKTAKIAEQYLAFYLYQLVLSAYLELPFEHFFSILEC